MSDLNKGLIADALFHAEHDLSFINGATIQDVTETGIETFDFDTSETLKKVALALAEFPEVEGKIFSPFPFAEQPNAVNRNALRVLFQAKDIFYDVLEHDVNERAIKRILSNIDWILNSSVVTFQFTDNDLLCDGRSKSLLNSMT